MHPNDYKRYLAKFRPSLSKGQNEVSQKTKDADKAHQETIERRREEIIRGLAPLRT